VRCLALACVWLGALGGCNLAPAYVRPEAPVPASWPTGDAYARRDEQNLPKVTYRDIFQDPKLRTLIGAALENGRDLRIAAANVASARALYRVQRAEFFPALSANAGAVFGGGSSPGLGARGGAAAGGGPGDTYSLYSVDLGLSALEIDLFGRVRNSSEAALRAYLATEAGARSARLALVSEVANTYLDLAADRSRLSIANQTVENANASIELARARLAGGISALLDLRQAETVVAEARAAVARQTTLVAQDVNALQLLVGAPFDPALMPESLESVADRVRALPAGLSSTVLLRRPDVAEAEYQLQAANARIGVARAAYFPTISLTGLVGFASSSLSNLFSSNAFNWNVNPNASLSIFDAGATAGNVAYAKAQRALYLAQYERAIQVAFREVADALARQGTIAAELQAEQDLSRAAEDSYRLADVRYRGGVESFLSSLEAQRTLFSARQSLIAARLLQAQTLVSLYRVLGGDSFEERAGDPT
jgi:multidrug efflux system outer membrane protein